MRMCAVLSGRRARGRCCKSWTSRKSSTFPSMATTSDRRAKRSALEDAPCVALGPENEEKVNRDRKETEQQKKGSARDTPVLSMALFLFRKCVAGGHHLLAYSKMNWATDRSADEHFSGFVWRRRNTATLLSFSLRTA